MSNKQFWCGYLEAGAKSSPVLHDNRLDTGSTDTIYLYNLRRDEVLEYKRAIIEPKLRELDSQDDELRMTLKAAYLDARLLFTPRGNKDVVIPSRGGWAVPTTYDEKRHAARVPEEHDDELLEGDEWMEEA